MCFEGNLQHRWIHSWDHGSVSVRVCRCLLSCVRCLEEAVAVSYPTFGLSFKSSHHELMSGAALWFPDGLAAFQHIIPKCKAASVPLILVHSSVVMLPSFMFFVNWFHRSLSMKKFIFLNNHRIVWIERNFYQIL